VADSALVHTGAKEGGRSPDRKNNAETGREMTGSHTLKRERVRVGGRAKKGRRQPT